jgi:hypothetical protein
VDQRERIEIEVMAPKPTDGKDELNLVEFPLCTLAHRSRPDQKTLQFEDRVWDTRRNVWVPRHFTITGSDAYGLPTALDDEVLLGLIQVTKLRGFAERQVPFTRYQLIQILGWRHDSKSYERIEESLNRWTGVTLYYQNAWWNKARQCWVNEKFHVLDNVWIYRVAREKLRLVAASLVGPERFETIFSRVMCLVSPEELQEVLIEEAVSPLTPQDQDRIAHMVEAGFNAWREFHERFSQRRREIRSQEPGLASWEDVSHFLSDYTAAQPVDGFTASRFLIADGRIESQDEQIRVFHLEGQNYFLGDHDGAVISGREGKDIAQLGLNVPAVTETLRKMALPATPTGAAHLRWPQDIPSPDWLPTDGAGILVFLRQTLRSDQRIGWAEQASSLHCYAVSAHGSATALQPEQKALLFRAIFKSVVRTKPDERTALLAALAEAEVRDPRQSAQSQSGMTSGKSFGPASSKSPKRKPNSTPTDPPASTTGLAVQPPNEV